VRFRSAHELTFLVDLARLVGRNRTRAVMTSDAVQRRQWSARSQPHVPPPAAADPLAPPAGDELVRTPRRDPLQQRPVYPDLHKRHFNRGRRGPVRGRAGSSLHETSPRRTPTFPVIRSTSRPKGTRWKWSDSKWSSQSHCTFRMI
jgi:hypothetical protein